MSRSRQPSHDSSERRLGDRTHPFLTIHFREVFRERLEKSQQRVSVVERARFRLSSARMFIITNHTGSTARKRSCRVIEGHVQREAAARPAERSGRPKNRIAQCARCVLGARIVCASVCGAGARQSARRQAAGIISAKGRATGLSDAALRLLTRMRRSKRQCRRRARQTNAN